MERAKRPSISQSGGLIPIKTLATYNTRWKIQGRIVEKSNITTFQRKSNFAGSNEGKIFSCVIMDKEGSQIQCKFWNNLADQFFPLIQKGKVYTMSKGRIGVANRRFAGTVDHDYEIIFERDADIGEVEDKEGQIPTQRKHTYQSLRSINLSTKKLPFMADILVVVHSYQQVREMASKMNPNESRKRRVITVVDATNFSLDVTLWGDESQVEDSLLETHPVIAIHNLQIREWRGRAGSTISQTEIVWKVASEASDELKGWYEANSFSASFESLSNIAGEGGAGDGGGRVAVKDATIADVVQEMAEAATDETHLFKVMAYVAQIFYRNVRQDNQINVSYMACPKCNKKLQGSSCSTCSEAVATAAPRLAFSITLTDESASGLIVRVFNDVAQQLIGSPAAKIVEVIPQVSQDTLPELLLEAFENSCIWRRYVFIIRARRETYQGDVRTNYAIQSASVATKGMVGAGAMQRLLSQVPNIFDGIQDTKRSTLCVEETKENLTKRAKVSSAEEDCPAA